jgi:hypothetical protein
MNLTTVRNTNQETIIHFSATGQDTASIRIADLAAPSQERNSDYPVVNIVRFVATGEDTSSLTVLRNDQLIISCAPENAPILDLTSMGISEGQYGDVDIVISNNQSTNVTGYITLRKVQGWSTKVETATYGAYDDETIVGPRDISGSPGPSDMPRSMLPVPGSGSYNFTLETDMSEAGNAYEDTSYYWDTPPPNMTPGLFRRAYKGNFTDAPGNSIDVNFCRTHTGWYGEVDPYVGFGNQDLEDASNYTLEWTGWFRAPKTGTYNFWLQSDDVAYMWMNYPAMANANADGNHIVTSNNGTNKVSNSLIMSEGNWYPVRIQFGEWGGAEACQVYWATTDDPVAYAGNDDGASGYQVWFHNSETQGI